MKSLKLMFFIIFVLLGSFIALVGYVPYMRYITTTQERQLQNIADMVLRLFPEIADVDRMYSNALAVTEAIAVVGTRPSDLAGLDTATAEARALDADYVKALDAEFKKALDGGYGEEKQRQASEFWRLNADFHTITETSDLSFVTLIKKTDDGVYRYILSSGFTNDVDNAGFGLADILYRGSGGMGSYGVADLGDAIVKAEQTKSFQIAALQHVETWGINLPAYSPILDSSGNVAAFIETDFDASTIRNAQNNARILLAVSIALAAVVALILATSVSNSLVKPIKEMKKLADALAKEQFDQNIEKFRKDEMGDMQRSMIKTRDNLKTALSNLKSERDEIAVMKDHLRTGVFLLDKDWVIQENYSQSLEDVLSAHELSGKKFTELLSATFSSKDMPTIEDFFAIVHSNKMKQRKLDSINPLTEIEYTSAEDGEKKTVRCLFAPLPREDDEVFLLGTVEDVTAETNLKNRLIEEEKARQDATRAMFEVLSVDPQTFDAFIEDAQYNFDKITEMLKGHTLSMRKAMVAIYQLVHATKSDAFILGLMTFGDRLHKFEDTIKEMREKDAPSFADELRMTAQLGTHPARKRQARRNRRKIALVYKCNGSGRRWSAV